MSDNDRYPRNTPQEIDITGLVDFVWKLRPLYLQLPLLRDIRKMTYEDAIGYFVNNKPEASFSKAAMILQKSEEQGTQFFFVQIFLKDNDEVLCKANGIPYGRRCLIRDIDNELKRVFGNNQVIIVT